MLRTITNKALGRSRLLPLWSVLLLFVLAGFLPTIAQGQVTYTWTGLGGNTDWSTAGNWSPTRPLLSALPTDKLVFDKGTPVSVTNIPTQAVGQLLVVNGTNLTIQQASLLGPQTLTLNGILGVGLNIEAGSALNVKGTSILNIVLLAGTSGSVAGNINFSNADHTITGLTAGSLVFATGASFTQDLGCDSNVFTSGGTDGVVVFSSGSTFIAKNGASPFGSGSKVVFQTGSLYSHQHGGLVSLSGRTFADFEMNAAGYNHSNPGTNGFTVDNLTVKAASNFTLNMTGGINIRGNLVVNSGVLTFAPAAANSLQFNGNGIQSIGGTGGTITINGLTDVVVASSSTLEIRRNLTIGGGLTVNGTLQYDATAARTLSVTGNLSGSGTVNMSGGSLAHVLNLGGASNSIANFVTAPPSSMPNPPTATNPPLTSTVNYNGNIDQQVFSSANYRNLTISGSGSKNMQGNVTVNNIASFQAGILSIGANNTLALNGMVASNTPAGQNNFYCASCSGSITGGNQSALAVGGSVNAKMYLPVINNGLLNLTINKIGGNKNIFLGSNLIIYDGGKLQLQDGYFNVNGKVLTLGESSNAVVDIVRNIGVLESKPVIAGRVNVTYTATTTDSFYFTGNTYELPTTSTELNNLTIVSPNIAVTLRQYPVNGSGTFTVNGIFTLGGNANTKLILNGQTLTLAGDYIRTSGIITGSSASSLIVQGSNKNITGTLNFDQASAASRSLQNLTVNLTGSSPALTLATHCEITNLNVTSGTLMATGSDVGVVNSTIASGGKFENTTGAFPTILPGSTAFRAFNNQNLAFVNKFDAVSASNNAGNSVTANNTDLTFTLNGAGSVYAVRNNKVLNPAPTAAMVTFQLAATNNGIATSNAAALFIGDNLGDNAARPGAASAVSLPINLTTSNTVYTWVVNRSGASREYNAPSGAVQTLANNSSDLWQGTTYMGNSMIPAAFTPTNFKQVKFVMDAGNGVIKLQNLKINPLATITTTTNTCYTAGYNFNVNYTLNEYTTAALTAIQTGGVTNRAQSLNEGNEMRVQLSNANGDFDSDINKNIIGKNNIVASGSVSLSGSIQAQIPAYALGGAYRYRVIATDMLISNPAKTGNSTVNANAMFFISPGISQSLLAFSNTLGSTLTASLPAGATGVTYQWGYRTTSGSGFVTINGATGQTYTPKANDLNSGNPGTYHVVCRVNFGACANLVGNEVTIYSNCANSGGINLVKNGTFDNYLEGSILLTPNSTIITGIGTKFITELRGGRKLYDSKGNVIGTVASNPTSDTQLTLTGSPTIDATLPLDTDNPIRCTATDISYKKSSTGGIRGGGAKITVVSDSKTINGSGGNFTSYFNVSDPSQNKVYDSNGNLIGVIVSMTNNTLVLQDFPVIHSSVNPTCTYPHKTAYSTNYLARALNQTDYFNAGTISASTNNVTVTGNSTKFLSEVKVGDIIRMHDHSNSGTVGPVELGRVASIQTDVQLTLASNATVNLSGASFVGIPPSLGNSGLYFNTFYRHDYEELYNEGNYTVDVNPKSYHGNFCDMTGAATNSAQIGGSGGKMLIANANKSSTSLVWTQILTGLTPNQNYVLTFNAASLAGPPQSLVFGMYINCNRVGEDISSDFTGNCKWAKYSIQVNAGSLTTFELGIANISSAADGNDVAIDDIQLYPCSDVLATPFAPVNKFVWRGFNTNWFNSDNWGVCPGIYPTCGDDVTIPANMPNYPVINANGPGGIQPVAKKVTIDPGAALTINPGINLNVCGDLENTGTINALNNVGSPSTISFIGYGSAATPPIPAPTQQTITTTSNSPFMNIVINNAPNKPGKVAMNSDVTVDGSLDIRTGNELVINGRTLTLNGTLSTNTGTITGSPSSRLVVGGTGDVTGPLRFTTPATSSSTEQTLGFLQMNRTSAGRLTLGTPLQLQSGVLRLDNGIIYTSLSPVAPSSSAPILTLDANSTVTGGGSYVVTDPLLGKSGGTDLSHVDGPMAKMTSNNSSFIFPVGDAGFLGQIGITPSNSTPTTYLARYVRESAYTVGTDVEKPALNHVSQMEYWTLDRPLGGASGKVTLHWTTYSIVSQVAVERNQLRIARYSGASPSGITSLGVNMWENQGDITVGGANTYNAGYVTTVNDASLFGAFTFASTIPNNPLPVELVSLKATPTQDGQVNVSWITASEHNSSHFLVQHSIDGRHFRSIGQVQALGETTTARSYQFLHTNPAPFNYYRLRSVDKDASSSFSPLVTAQLQAESQAAPLLYPNPNEGKQFFVKTSYSDKVSVLITSLLGVEVFRQSVLPQQGLLSLWPNLPQGTYVVALKEGYKTSYVKLIVE